MIGHAPAWRCPPPSRPPPDRSHSRPDRGSDSPPVYPEARRSPDPTLAHQVARLAGGLSGASRTHRLLDDGARDLVRKTYRNAVLGLADFSIDDPAVSEIYLVKALRGAAPRFIPGHLRAEDS